MYGHGQKNWALDMTPTFANHTHTLKASLLSDKRSQTILLDQCLMDMEFYGKFVQSNADQKNTRIGLIVDTCFLIINQNVFNLNIHTTVFTNWHFISSNFTIWIRKAKRPGVASDAFHFFYNSKTFLGLWGVFLASNSLHEVRGQKTILPMFKLIELWTNSVK